MENIYRKSALKASAIPLFDFFKSAKQNNIYIPTLYAFFKISHIKIKWKGIHKILSIYIYIYIYIYICIHIYIYIYIYILFFQPLFFHLSVIAREDDEIQS